MGMYGSPDLTQLNTDVNNQVKKKKNPFKILLFIVLCVPVLFITYVLLISVIKTTNETMYKEKYLSKEEYNAINYIREQSKAKNISIDEFIDIIKSYEEEKL